MTIILVLTALLAGGVIGAAGATGRRHHRNFNPWCERMRDLCTAQAFGTNDPAAFARELHGPQLTVVQGGRS